jgi:hypothetical protein
MEFIIIGKQSVEPMHVYIDFDQTKALFLCSRNGI